MHRKYTKNVVKCSRKILEILIKNFFYRNALKPKKKKSKISKNTNISVLRKNNALK